MNWSKFWLWYNIAFAMIMVATAAFVATSDLWVRIDGWLAIANAITAVRWMYIIDEENRNGED